MRAGKRPGADGTLADHTKRRHGIGGGCATSTVVPYAIFSLSKSLSQIGLRLGQSSHINLMGWVSPTLGVIIPRALVLILIFQDRGVSSGDWFIRLSWLWSISSKFLNLRIRLRSYLALSFDRYSWLPI